MKNTNLFDILNTCAQDPFNFDLDPDPGSALEKMDPDPGSALEKMDPDPGHCINIY